MKLKCPPRGITESLSSTIVRIDCDRFNYKDTISTESWQESFADAKMRILRILRFLRKDTLADDELRSVVRDASEAQRQLRTVAAALDGFDQFAGHLLPRS